MKLGLLVSRFLSGAIVRHLLELGVRSRALRERLGNPSAYVAFGYFTLAIELQGDFQPLFFALNKFRFGRGDLIGNLNQPIGIKRSLTLLAL